MYIIVHLFPLPLPRAMQVLRDGPGAAFAASPGCVSISASDIPQPGDNIRLVGRSTEVKGHSD